MILKLRKSWQQAVENGFNVTQATISRDIRELNLTKIATKGGKQKYAVREQFRYKYQIASICVF